MGVILIALLVLCIGIWLLIWGDFNKFDLPFIGASLTAVSSIILIICGSLLIYAHYQDTNYCIGYYNDKQYIESNYDNYNLTDNERVNLNNLIISDNNIIITCRTWRDNFWIGWFCPYRTGDLKLFDIKKIKSAKLKVEIESKNKIINNIQGN